MSSWIKLDKFVDQFVVGGILFTGTWYLHRPFLSAYFPNIAPDDRSTAGGLSFSVAVFLAASVVVGILVFHLADIAAVIAFRDGSGSGKSGRTSRRVLQALGRVFVWMPGQDPRVSAVNRYMSSPRRDEFVRLAESWAMTSADALASPAEVVLVHQHLVARLRATSARTEVMLEKLYEPALFSGALFTTFMLLTFVAILSFATAALVPGGRGLEPMARLAIALAIYVVAIVAGGSFRRRFRDMCAAALTTALHFYRLDAAKQAGRAATA